MLVDPEHHLIAMAAFESNMRRFTELLPDNAYHRGAIEMKLIVRVRQHQSGVCSVANRRLAALAHARRREAAAAGGT